MTKDVLVKFEGISKKFCYDLKRSLWYGIEDLKNEILCGSSSETLRKGEFLALDDVSFEIHRGEMLGLVGQNGAGKSTILKLLNGLINPDKGKITMKGRVQALIELGAGFSPILTGRENIYINASVLGIDKEHVDRKMDEIIEFAGIEEFIDSPVQNYSSGMRGRLGFAVVSQLDPDVLLIDEVLAVGDVAFQEKCMRRMDVLRNSNKGIIFVTHSLYQVESLCDKALWLEKGRVMQYGKAGDVVRAFLDEQERRAISESQHEGVSYNGRVTKATKAYLDKMDEERVTDDKAKSDEKELVEIINIELLNSEGEVCKDLPFMSDLTVRLKYRAKQKIKQPLFNFRFFSKGKAIFETSMLIDGYGPECIEGEGTVECNIPQLPLTPKVYEILLFVRNREGTVDIAVMRTISVFRITDEHLERVSLEGPMAINHMRQGAPVYIPHTWKFYNE